MGGSSCSLRRSRAKGPPPSFHQWRNRHPALPRSFEPVTTSPDHCKGKGSPLTRKKEKGDCHLHAVFPWSCCDPGRKTIPTTSSKASISTWISLHHPEQMKPVSGPNLKGDLSCPAHKPSCSPLYWHGIAFVVLKANLLILLYTCELPMTLKYFALETFFQTNQPTQTLWGCILGSFLSRERMVGKPSHLWPLYWACVRPLSTKAFCLLMS